MVFWIPFLLAAGTATSLALQIYSTWEGYNARNKTIDYTHKSNTEVERFWNDYYRNTGYRPLYPYRSGAVVNEGYIDSLYAANWQAASALTGGVFNHSNKVKNIYTQR